HGITGLIDSRTESIGRKIRDTELKKIPFMLIVGEKEAASNTVSVRKQGEGDMGSMSVEEFATYFKGLLEE
ncbi:MAG: His/Gly/Thr/Pro-type tRNA ligase C-terminal domain-containing protein, partial [Bacteroidota bacterium]